jgi:hypothetical protein
MNTPVASYEVELLYGEIPLFTREEVLEKLRDRCGAVSPVDNTQGGGFNYFFPSVRVPFKGQEMPVQVALEVKSGPLSSEELKPYLSQTWDWADKMKALGQHGSRIVLKDLLAQELAYKSRIGLFHNVLLGVMELLMPVAIVWKPSQKIVDPVALRLALRPGDKRDLTKGAVNVRRTLTKGDYGGIVMDTIGFGALGLPDFEVPLGDRLPAPVENVLKALARYQYDLGDVIPDGRKVPAPPPEAHWVCRRSTATVGPEREVILVGPP